MSVLQTISVHLEQRRGPLGAGPGPAWFPTLARTVFREDAQAAQEPNQFAR